MSAAIALAQLRYLGTSRDFYTSEHGLDAAHPVDAALLALSVNDTVQGSRAMHVLHRHAKVFTPELLTTAFHTVGLPDNARLAHALLTLKHATVHQEGGCTVRVELGDDFAFDVPSRLGLSEEDGEDALLWLWRSVGEAAILGVVEAHLTKALATEDNRARLQALVAGKASLGDLLLQAVDHGDVARTKALLAAGADPNHTRRSTTPVSLAVYVVRSHDGDPALLEALLAANPSPEAGDNDELLERVLPDPVLFGRLMEAGWRLHPGIAPKVLQDLLGRVATFQRKVDRGRKTWPAEERDVRKAHACLELAWAAQPDLSGWGKDRGALLSIGVLHALSDLDKLLTAGVPFENLDEDGYGPPTALHWWAARGRLDGCLRLVEQGATLNAAIGEPDWIPRMGAFPLRRGMTPLDVAVSAKRTAVADWLRAHGGRPGTLTGIPLWLQSTAKVALDAVGGSARDGRVERICNYLDEVLVLTDGVGLTVSLGPLRRAIEADQPIMVGEAVDEATAEAVAETFAAVGAVVQVEKTQ